MNEKFKKNTQMQLHFYNTQTSRELSISKHVLMENIASSDNWLTNFKYISNIPAQIDYRQV